MKTTNKAIIASLLILCALALSGCTNTLSEQESLKQLNQLQEKYFVRENFSTSPVIMNDYINGLSKLRGKTNTGIAKIIDAELASAQAFNYLSQSMAESTKINFQSIKCSSTEVIQTKKYAQLSITSSTKAISIISNLGENEKKYLRTNQLEMVKKYSDLAAEITKYFDDKC